MSTENPTETVTKTKFTATAVRAEDKALVQALRKQFNATEKEMMAALIAVGSKHTDELGAFFITAAASVTTEAAD